MKNFQPDLSSDVDLHPGEVEKWGLGFLINRSRIRAAGPRAASHGRASYNTFYWIDPPRGICAVIMMQFLPFVDKEAVGLLGDFERSVCANL